MRSNQVIPLSVGWQTAKASQRNCFLRALVDSGRGDPPLPPGTKRDIQLRGPLCALSQSPERAPPSPSPATRSRNRRRCLFCAEAEGRQPSSPRDLSKNCGAEARAHTVTFWRTMKAFYTRAPRKKRAR